MGRFLNEVFYLLTRKKTPVVFNDLASIEPISSKMGCDRGTPITRYYVEKFLEEKAPLIQGDVMEVAEPTYAETFGSDAVKNIEVLHVSPDNPKATIVGDLTDPESLPENAVDCFICTQTFNFIYDVEAAVEGAHHVLRPGGTLLATVSGISHISRYDMERWGDYWRFTSASLEKLMEPVFEGGLEIVPYGNVVAATAFLQGLAVEDLPDKEVLDKHDPDYQMVLAVMATK